MTDTVKEQLSAFLDGELPEAETTFCPKCQQAVVEREVFAVTRFRLKDGKCPECGTVVAGVWSA